MLNLACFINTKFHILIKFIQVVMQIDTENSNHKISKLEIIFGKPLADKVVSANVLVVGAGGIGCELVKCLSVTGFQKLSVIDLDTIDISNLNRQFLFRRHHVDMPKSETLKESICAQNSKIEIDDYIGKI